MARLHIHINTEAKAFEPAVSYYSTLFSAAPDKLKADYAKWSLQDPAVNFVLEPVHDSCSEAGIHHLGIEVDNREAISAIQERLEKSGAETMNIGKTNCCYSLSEKFWSRAPSGQRWEIFRSFADTDEYGCLKQSETQNYR